MSPVCVSNKAFDRIDHWLLFEKLIIKDVPLFIIRMLVYWYSQQKMYIKWGNTTSPSFNVTKGGILSPVLFNVLMDSLSSKLIESNIGGHINGKLINHLCYADDLCIISLSSSGMQNLLNICNDFAKKHFLTYNGAKSFSLCFVPKTIKFFLFRC